VAFRDESMEYRATVMRLNGAGTAWEILGSRGFSRGVADYIDLELAGTVPHVAFRDLGREARAVVLRLVE
jgi:hypothetical protein